MLLHNITQTTACRADSIDDAGEQTKVGSVLLSKVSETILVKNDDHFAKRIVESLSLLSTLNSYCMCAILCCVCVCVCVCYFGSSYETDLIAHKKSRHGIVDGGTISTKGGGGGAFKAPF